MKKLLAAILLLVACSSSAAAEENGLLAEVSLDSSGRYLAKLSVGSPPQPKLLLLDIAHNSIWLPCQETPKPPKQFMADTFTFNATDGANPGQDDVQVKGLKVFCISPSSPKSPAYGTAGLGPGKASLPSQLASHLHLPRRFAYCLSGVALIPTPLFLASSNYTFMPWMQVGVPQNAPLLKPTKKKPGYRVGLHSIQVGDKTLSINPKVFRGGLEISTTEPYTKLVRPAYMALVKAFRQAESGIKRVPAPPPFDTCFNATGLGSTRVGPPVNAINFMLGGNITEEWPFFGHSSMVFVSEDVMCLGFLDAGPLPSAHSVLGTHQQQDSLVELDLDKNQLAFFPSLLFIRTTCANFNFTRGSF